MPISASLAHKPPSNSTKHNQQNRFSYQPTQNLTRSTFSPYAATHKPQLTNFPSPNSRPYIEKCQLCGQQGHSAKRSSAFKYMPWNSNSQTNTNTSTSYTPCAHFATNSAPFATEWLLDSGASSCDYTDTNNIMIGDGTGLAITHTGSTTLSSPSKSFHLNNVLCVPSMKKIYPFFKKVFFPPD